MKVSFIVLSDSEIVSSVCDSMVSNICSLLYKNGQEVVKKSVIKGDSEILRSSLDDAFSNSECILLACEKENEKFYMCKKVLCEMFDTRLMYSSYAKDSIDEVVKTYNIPLKKEDEKCAEMPEIGRTVKNPFSVYQGCLIKDEERLVFLLPLDGRELNAIFFSSVLPYILHVENGKGKTYILKTFGIKYEEMISLIREETKNNLGIYVTCNEHLLLGEVITYVPKGIRNDYAKRLVTEIYKKMLPYVYSDKDETQSEFIYSLLSLRKMKLTLAEDFTAGNMCATLHENLKVAEDILSEVYIVPSDKSKMEVLGVESDILKKAHLDYSEMAYQMALGALSRSGADVAVSSCGNLDRGELTFAVGTEEGIHVYSRKVTGNAKEKISVATSAIFFQLIKKIRQNDFNLGQFTV